VDPLLSRVKVSAGQASTLKLPWRNGFRQNTLEFDLPLAVALLRVLARLLALP